MYRRAVACQPQRYCQVRTHSHTHNTCPIRECVVLLTNFFRSILQPVTPSRCAGRDARHGERRERRRVCQRRAAADASGLRAHVRCVDDTMLLMLVIFFFFVRSLLASQLTRPHSVVAQRAAATAVDRVQRVGLPRALDDPGSIPRRSPSDFF